MSFTRWSPLLGTLVRLNESGTGPPWSLEIYNPNTHAWEVVGIVGAPSYAPLMTGDEAPTMIGTGDGQPVLVPIL